MDYYELLGVTRNACVERITAAYRELAKKYHPDLHPNDVECVRKFKELSLAFETLTDMNKRAIYNGKHPEKVKPKPQAASPVNSPIEKYVWDKRLKQMVLNVAYFKAHDPNFGPGKTTFSPPPPKYDLWGKPLNAPSHFKDSVRDYI
jgi:curved DNA-binding protein CbpA